MALHVRPPSRSAADRRWAAAGCPGRRRPGYPASSPTCPLVVATGQPARYARDMPTVELIYDGDCPHVDGAREQLLRAFAEVQLEPRFREWRRDDPDAPDRVRGCGSPTILVDGRDVAAAAEILRRLLPSLRRTGRRHGGRPERGGHRLRLAGVRVAEHEPQRLSGPPGRATRSRSFMARLTPPSRAGPPRRRCRSRP